MTSSPSGEFRERVVKFHRDNATNKSAAEINELLQQTTLSEDALLAALEAKYGGDRTALLKRDTPALRSTVVRVSERSTSDNDGKESSRRQPSKQEEDEDRPPQMSDDDDSDEDDEDANGPSSSRRAKKEAKTSSAQREKKQRTTIDGGPVLTQLVIAHLESRGLAAVAGTLKQELQQRGLSAKHYLPSASPIPHAAPPQQTAPFDATQQPHKQTSPSALTRLLCPASSTRAFVQLLLSDSAAKLGRASDDATLPFLLELIGTPMWWSGAEGYYSHIVHARYDTGRVRAATLNQLVENMTCITIQPHVNITEAQRRASLEFSRYLILTHRHFTTSHALLAKLIERCFVPLFIPFTARFDRFAINVIKPHKASSGRDGGASHSQRMALWREISKRLQVRVLGCVSLWLEVQPRDFDAAMLHAVHALLEELCYAPTSYADTPTDLMLCAEKIRLQISARNIGKTKKEDPTDSSATTAAGSSSAAAETVAFLFTRHRTLQLETNRNALSPSKSFRGSVAALSSSNASQQQQQQDAEDWSALCPASAVELVSMDELRLGNQLTALHHAMLRRVQPGDLFTYAVHTSMLSAGAMQHPALHLHSLLGHGEDLMFWVVSEVLRAGGALRDTVETQERVKGAGTGRGGAKVEREGGTRDFLRRAIQETTSLRNKVVEKFASLAFRLIEMNNLFGAFFVMSGLWHPAVSRLFTSSASGGGGAGAKRRTEGSAGTGTDALLSPGARHALNELRAFFDFSKGYHSYKEYVSAIPDDDVYPVVPIIAIWIDELRRLHFSQPSLMQDHNNRALVHWRKFAVMGEIYEKLLRCTVLRPVPAEFVVIRDCAEWFSAQLSTAVHDPKLLLRWSTNISKDLSTPGIV